MKVNCPSCKRAYKVDDNRVQGQGIVMRCPQCGGNFFVTPSGFVRDASSGSIPTEPLRDVSSVQPRRPSQSPRGASSIPPSFEESGSGKFEFRGDAVTVKPASTEKFGGAGPQAGPPRSLAIRDSWGFEMAAYAGVELDLPMKKADPFDDLGLAVSKQEASMELRAVGGEENTVDLPTPVDMAERESRAAPKPKTPPPVPKLSDDPFGEIVLGQSPTEGPAQKPKEGGKPPPPPKPPPAPVLVSSVPPALTMSSQESDFGDIRLSGFEMKLSTPPKAPTSRASVDPPPDRLGIDLVGGRASVSLPPLGSSMARDAGPSKPPEKEEIKLASVPPMGFGYGEFDLGSTPSGHGEGEFDLGGAAQRVSRPSGAAQPALPSLRPSPADSSSEFDAIPTHRGAENKGRGGYDGPPRDKIELAVDPRERLSDKGRIIDEAVPQKAGSRAKKFAGWRTLERQSRKVKLALLGVLLLVIGIGVSLNWTPLGLFGTTAIANMLPSSVAERVVDDKARLVTDALLKDDFRECQSAHEEVSLALQELPNQEDLRLLGVFLVNYMEHRFGEDKRLSTEAGKWLGSIQLEESESKWAPLARGARDVRTGASELGYLSSIDPKLKTHALALQVMAAIASRKPDAALAIAKQLQSAQTQAPRSAFFMAQALAAAGKWKEAIAALEKLLELAPKHTDGAALLARELLEVRPFPAERIQKVVADVVPRARPRVAASAQAVLARLHYSLRHFAQAKEAVDQALRGFSNEPIALVVKGDLALQDGDPVLAATMYNRALAEAPSDLAASLGLVEVKLHEGRLTEAKDKAFALVNANKGSARAHYVMGLALESIDSGEAARAELKKAIELDAEGLDAYLALARSHMKAKEDAEAMAILDKAAAALPGNPLVARTLAAAQGARGDYAAAIVELNKAVEMAPDDPETYFMMAQMYRQMKSFADARSVLMEVEKRSKDYPGFALEKGLISEQEGNLASALEAYEKALAAQPDNPNAKIRVGAVAHALGDEAKAEKILAEAVAALPGSAEANYLLGEVYRVTKRPSEAMRLLLVAKELNRTNGLYALRYGMSLMDLGDQIAAMRAFEEARTLAPDLGEIYLRIGEVELVQGSAKDAIASAEKSLRMQPTLLEAHGMLGRAYEELADFKTARMHYRIAANALPKDAQLHFLLGLSELKVSGERASFAPLEKAVKVADESGDKPEWLPEALFRLGMAQSKMGKTSEAIVSFKRYFDVAPEKHIDRAEVRANLERLTLN